MERSDFVDRRGERKLDFLKYYGLVERIYARDNGLSVAMLRLLFYLDAIPYFTRDDFHTGTLYYTWDKRLFNYILKEDWIKVSMNSDKRAGDHYHYNVSLKGKILINTIYKILCGQEELPDSCKRNRNKSKSRYIDKTEISAIEAMERSRAKDRFDNY